MVKYINILWFILGAFSCTSHTKVSEGGSNIDSYAKGFEIRQFHGFQQVIINNPWQKSKGEKFSYFLSHDPAQVPDSLKNDRIIKTPLQRVVVFSTSHVGFIAALGQNSTITGVSGKDFINDSIVCSSIMNKRCIDIGSAPNIDFEGILMLHPDMVFLYGLDPSVAGLVKRLEEAGIHSVMVSEFLEEHPLGKAEWIRFFSAFFECETLGDSIFNTVKHNYHALRDSAIGIEGKPKILVGLPWKDTWYMAGGRSFMARFIEDAGGEYLWKENSNIDFIPLDLESVFLKAETADIWINTGSAENLNAVLSVDPRLQHIPAFRNGRLFNNNKRSNPLGGNDFWESGAVRPDKVLNDLIDIFHPEIQKNNDLFYYRQLK